MPVLRVREPSRLVEGHYGKVEMCMECRIALHSAAMALQIAVERSRAMPQRPGGASKRPHDGDGGFPDPSTALASRVARD